MWLNCSESVSAILSMHLGRAGPSGSDQSQGLPESILSYLLTELNEFPCRMECFTCAWNIPLFRVPLNTICLNELPSWMEGLISEETGTQQV